MLAKEYDPCDRKVSRRNCWKAYLQPPATSKEHASYSRCPEAKLKATNDYSLNLNSSIQHSNNGVLSYRWIFIQEEVVSTAA